MFCEETDVETEEVGKWQSCADQNLSSAMCER